VKGDREVLTGLLTARAGRAFAAVVTRL